MKPVIEKPYVIFGFLIRRARREEGLSVTDTAREVGLSASSLRATELGHQRIAFHFILRLAKMFNVDLNSLKEI